MSTAILPLAAAFAAGLFFVPAVRRIARERGMVARPRADRWHSRPTALMGGVAIWASTLAGFATVGPASVATLALLAAATALFAAGALDDRFQVRPVTKLVAQCLAATVAVAAGFRVQFFPFEMANLVASFVWIVAVTNAVNLLDNMDGLAGGIVLIACGFLAWSFGTSVPLAMGLALALIGALAAFLLFNMSPASIFMGDSGSMFIGFLLATLSLQESLASDVVSFVAVPALIMSVPILDTTLVTFTRLLARRSIAVGGYDHTSHRLVRLGLSEAQAVWLLWGLGLVAGSTAAFTQHYSYALGMGLLPLVIAGFFLIGAYLADQKSAEGLSEEDLSAAPPPGFLRLAISIAYRRRVIELALDFLLIVACYYCSYGLRFDFDPASPYWSRFSESLPLVIGATLFAFWQAGVYHLSWRQAAIADLAVGIRACILAVSLSVATLILLFRFEGYSRSVFVIYGLLLFVTAILSRASFTVFDETLGRRRHGLRVVIAGAGANAEVAARILTQTPALGLELVGFVDDDEQNWGRRICGRRVLGATRDLEQIHRSLRFEQILVARTLPSGAIEDIRRFCSKAEVGLRSLHVQFADLEAPRDTGGESSGSLAGSAGVKRPKVLVVEDDPDAQRYLRGLLRDHFEIIFAENGEDFRKQLQANLGEVSIVLMDIALRGEEDGFQLARYVRDHAEWNRVPVVVTTAYDMPEKREYAFAVGCDAYFSKPFRGRDLMAKMNSLIASSGDKATALSRH